MSRKYLALIVAFAVAACSDKGKQAVADSELAHDIALANQSPATPQFRDTALTAAPETRSAPMPPRKTKAPAPASSTRRRITPEVVSRPRPVTPTPTVERAAPAPARRSPGFHAGTSF